MTKKKQIIDLQNERMGLFVTNNSIDLDIMYGRNFLQTDNAQEVIIHKINIIETKVQDYNIDIAFIHDDLVEVLRPNDQCVPFFDKYRSSRNIKLGFPASHI